MKTEIIMSILVIFILIAVTIIIIIVAVVIIIIIVVVPWIHPFLVKQKKSSVLFTYNPPSKKKSPFIITGRRCCLANHPD